MNLVTFFTLAGLIACLAAPVCAETLDLDQGWNFRLAPEDPAIKAHPESAGWRAASVPGTVQTDLLAAGAISDPFYRDNEAALQWIGLADWEYRRELPLDPAMLRHDHVELVFEGLDTLAEVRVNGKTLGSADNMFRRWRIDAKAALKTGGNEVTIRFQSPIARLLPWLLRQPYALPGEFDSAFGDEPKGMQTSAYLRKAAYHYGWDWGPRFVTEGIWRPVRLEAWDDVRVADFHVAQPHVAAEAADLSAEIDIRTDRATQLHVALSVTAPDGTQRPAVETDVTVDPGQGPVTLPLRVPNPQLWYPVGYGDQALYMVSALVSQAGHPPIRLQKRIGLRHVELRRQPDQWGKSFDFIVNGIPIFAKGANLIPFDSFAGRADARMRAILVSARDAHMNMLRVWGGGVYQSDEFYDLADELGILIWQDFMFGGAITPYDPAYRETVRQEAVEQVTRLRDHPSIVLWCGNNEVQTGWESWPDRQDFKERISPGERERIVTGMTVLFGDVLRGVVARYDGEVPYWASTPGTNFDGPANVLDDGDYHYWQVWSGPAEPVERYLATTPRFQSEYGLQSFPDLKTIAAFAAAGDRTPNSPVMRAHQKFANGNGNDRLLFYIRREYGEPADFDAFVYLSQVMQADGIALAAKHLRASRPHSMGSLYWQLNDVWPGASWSSIDYFGRWKALQFRARHFYAPLLMAAQHLDGKTTLTAVSDEMTQHPARWRLRVMDVDGAVLADKSGAVTLSPLSATAIGEFTDQALLVSSDPRRTFAVAELLDGERVMSRDLVYFRPAKEVVLKDPGIEATLAPAEEGYQLTLHATRLARALWIGFGALDADLSDNSIDLLPGEQRTLTVRSDAGLEALRAGLSLRSLAGATRESLP